MLVLVNEPSNLLSILDLIGIFVFGLSGATVAVRRNLDLFGIIVLAIVAATAGGVIRDMAIGDTPVTLLRNPMYLVTACASGVTAFFCHRLIERLDKPVMVLDAIGLGMFAVVGTQKGLAFGLHPISACMIGVLTASGGGAVRDILVAEVPRVLREDIYAVAAIIGAIVVVLGNYLNFSADLTAIVAATITFVVRMLSVRLGLRIPRAR